MWLCVKKTKKRAIIFLKCVIIPICARFIQSFLYQDLHFCPINDLYHYQKTKMNILIHPQ